MKSLANMRRNYIPNLPNILKDLRIVTLSKDKHPSTTHSDVAELIPYTKYQPFMHESEKNISTDLPLKIGVVLSGG